MDPDTPLLLEPIDAGRILGLSPTRVRELADEGSLPVLGRTRRGVRIFRAADVERLRQEREANP
jgi:DNA-binding transcriptional MerR regulator